VIFVTVGTQLAFDRLVNAVDAWAGAHQDLEFFAQIGPTTIRPKFMAHAEFLPPSRVSELMLKSDLIVSHAGMGSILSALKYRKPILIMPRKAGLHEHRNDHQLATAKWLAGRQGVNVAWDESEVSARLDDRHVLAAGDGLPEYASGPLVDQLAAFIAQSK